MVNGEGLILHKTGHEGRRYMIMNFKNNHPITPIQVENVLDLGYMGVKNDFPTVNLSCHLERVGRKEWYYLELDDIRPIVSRSSCWCI